VGVIFRRFWIFQVSREKNREFGFQTLSVGLSFREFYVHYLKVTKMDSIWSFSLHCLQPISLKFSNVKKKEYIFAGFLLEGVCFHGI